MSIVIMQQMADTSFEDKINETPLNRVETTSEKVSTRGVLTE